VFLFIHRSVPQSEQASQIWIALPERPTALLVAKSPISGFFPSTQTMEGLVLFICTSISTLALGFPELATSLPSSYLLGTPFFDVGD